MKIHRNLVLIFLISFFYSYSQIEVGALNRKDVKIEEIQKAIEHNLKDVKIKKIGFYNIYKIKNKKQRFFYSYFSEASKNRILELLKGEWTEEELDFLMEQSLSYEKDTVNKRNFFYKNAKKIALKKEKEFSMVWDSVLKVRRDEVFEGIKSKLYIPLDVIKIAGYLKDDIFLPYLTKLGEGYMKDEKVLELTLARYGIEPYLSESLKKYSFNEPNFSAANLSFICNRAAIGELYNAVLNDDRIVCDSGGEDCYGFYAQSYLELLLPLIENEYLIEKIEGIAKESYSNSILNLKSINDIREVLIDNRDLILNANIDCEASYLRIW